MLGMIANYGIGRLMGERVLKYFLKEKYDHFMKTFNKFGGAIIVLGNILPSPIEVVSIFLGATKYNFKKFIIYTTIGKIAKFYLIYSARNYFVEEVIPTFQNLM